MQIKRHFKDFAKRFGFDIVRYVPEVSKPFDVLSLVVEERLRLGTGFYFLQVGANDGVLDDPIRHLVTRHALKGLLVEPLPDLFDTLKKTYAGQAGLSFENVAIGDRPGSATIYRVKSAAQVPEHWHGMASFSHAHLLKEGAPADLIEPCTVRDLLARHSINRIDLLQVDTEGYDYEIVKSVLEAGILPAIINYEHCHLMPAIRHAAWQMLVERGYRFLEVGKDTLAVHHAGP